MKKKNNILSTLYIQKKNHGARVITMGKRKDVYGFKIMDPI
jgi:hypothetical protein